jgi:hypothetical protein
LTISDADRDLNTSMAFEKILEHIGDAFTPNAPFSPADPRFEAIVPTTWKRLERLGFLKGTSAPILYFLTASGFTEALIQTGVTKTDAFRVRMGKLAAVLKDRIKGRAAEALMSSFDVAKSIEAPVGWVQNVIAAGLLERQFGIQGAHLYESNGHIISVPIDFGHKL